LLFHLFYNGFIVKKPPINGKKVMIERKSKPRKVAKLQYSQKKIRITETKLIDNVEEEIKHSKSSQLRVFNWVFNYLASFAAPISNTKQENF
jgi:hypothetical protein